MADEKSKKSKKPNVTLLSQDENITDDKSDFIRELRISVAQDDTDRAHWVDKSIIANNQRLGIKRYSNYPYVGAPDIPLPETDKLIKKSLPNLVLSAVSPKNPIIVDVKPGSEENPEMKEKARKSQAAMNMIIRSPELDWFNKLMLAADNSKHYGHCIFRTYEEFCSIMVHKVIDLDEYDETIIKQLKIMPKEELVQFLSQRYDLDPEDDDEKETIDDIIEQFKSGETVIEFDVERVKSYPQVDVVNPLDLIVPAYTTEINKASRICYEYWLTQEQLELYMDKGIFLKQDLDEYKIPKREKHKAIAIYSDMNEGIENSSSEKDQYRIWEICCWYKEKGKRPKQKVYTLLADVSKTENSLLQEIDFPFDFNGGWFYDKHDNERKSNRYFNSRGVPEQVRALQEISERCINNMIIRDEYNNTPVWEVLDTSQILDTHQRLAPGQKIPVRQLGTEIAALNAVNKPDMSSDRMMQIIKAYTEEYLSTSDQLFRNATNQGGGKTLGEIQIGIQQNSGPLNLDIIAWNDVLSRVYRKMFRIMSESLGESIYLQGEEITKEDFNFPAEIKSNGSLEVSNKEMATQKSMMRLQVLLNPALQDIVNSEDRYNAMKDWLEKDGVNNPDNFITDPKVIAQEQLRMMQQQMGQMQQESQQLTKDNEKQKQAGKKKQAELQAQEEMSKELEEQNMDQVGQQIGEGLVGGLQSSQQ